MFAGTPQPLALLHQFRMYDELGYVYYHCESMGRDEQRKIVHWVQAQLMWDASLDPDELLQTFCMDYYGDAGKDVLDVLMAMDARCRRMDRIILGSLGVTQSLMPQELCENGRDILAAAMRKVRGRERDRLARFRSTFEMLSLRAEAARACYTAMDARTKRSVKDGMKALDAFEEHWEDEDLSLTCSPAIKGRTLFLRKVMEDIEGPIVPTAAKNLVEADTEAVVEEAFARVERPKTLANLVVLPEVWKFKPDLQRRGKELGWATVDFDGGGWNDLSTWNFYERQGYDRYDGAFCYRVRFDAPQFPAGKKILLRIGSLDDEGDIYVNGKLAYERRHTRPLNWKTSFAIDVTDLIRPGSVNTIAVLGNDEYGMGGLWRPSVLYTE